MLSSETREEIERRALEITAELDAKRGPYNAEIVPDVTPQWHILTTHPSKEDKAADYLAERCFGVFVPRFQNGARVKVEVHPNYCQGQKGRVTYEWIDLSEKLIFPGRIFVFVWDIQAHWRRVKACSGVGSIMVDDRERPIVVSSADINWIQALQFSLTPMPKSKRDRHGSGNKSGTLPNGNMLIRTKSYWNVDGVERTRLLDKAMTIPSQTRQ